MSPPRETCGVPHCIVVTTTWSKSTSPKLLTMSVTHNTALILTSFFFFFSTTMPNHTS